MVTEVVEVAEVVVMEVEATMVVVKVVAAVRRAARLQPRAGEEFRGEREASQLRPALVHLEQRLGVQPQRVRGLREAHGEVRRDRREARRDRPRSGEIVRDGARSGARAPA